MNRAQAVRLNTLTKASSSDDDYVRQVPIGRISYQGFAKRPAIGAYEVEHEGRVLQLGIVDWNKTGDFRLVVIKGATTLEVREVKRRDGAEYLRWQYQPNKQDAKNPQRKRRFEELGGTLDNWLRFPSTSTELRDLIDQLRDLVDRRTVSDTIDDDFPKGAPESDVRRASNHPRARGLERHSERIAEMTRMLLRIPIQRAQRVMYKFVLDADDHSFLRSAAEATLGFDRQQFNGVLGALRLRINKTPGPLSRLKPGLPFVLESSVREGEEVFTAKPELLEALHGIPELIARLAADIEAVRDGDEFRLEQGSSFSAADELALEEDVDELRTDERLSVTERAQLIRARVGQGLFRERVARVEPCCRITGISDLRHLRASHIKPWRLCTNAERVDASNGLLLAPHIDHLFDRGYISFGDSGAVLVSPQLDRALLRSWGFDIKRKVGTFSASQRRYLAHHRAETFLRE